MLLRPLQKCRISNSRRLVFTQPRKLSAASLQQKTILKKPHEMKLKSSVSQNKYYSTQSKEQVEDVSEEENHEQNSNEEVVKNIILQNALTYVHEVGWSHEAIVKGAEDAGYSSALAGMFDDSKSALVLHFIKQCNNNLETYLIEQSSTTDQDEKRSTTQFVKAAIKYRLNMLVPYIDHWGDAMAILVQPQNLYSSSQELGRMTDDIWHYAGDKSADFSWYTKRGLLTKVYLSTQAIMITDKTSDFEDTWKFVDRRFDDVKTIMQASQTINSQLNMLGDATFAAYTVVQNMTGFNSYKR